MIKILKIFFNKIIVKKLLSIKNEVSIYIDIVGIQNIKQIRKEVFINV